MYFYLSNDSLYISMCFHGVHVVHPINPKGSEAVLLFHWWCCIIFQRLHQWEFDICGNTHPSTMNRYGLVKWCSIKIQWVGRHRHSELELSWRQWTFIWCGSLWGKWTRQARSNAKLFRAEVFTEEMLGLAINNLSKRHVPCKLTLQYGVLNTISAVFCVEKMLTYVRLGRESTRYQFYQGKEYLCSLMEDTMLNLMPAGKRTGPCNTKETHVKA